MSRQPPPTRGRHACSSSSGSASYQGISGATSPIYHLPQEPPFTYDNTKRKPYHRNDEYIDDKTYKDQHNYYNMHPKLYCTKDSVMDTHSYQYFTDRDERGYRNIENTVSDDSNSSRFQPYCNHERVFYRRDQERRYSNNDFSEYESDFPITHTKKSFHRQDSKYQSSRSNYAHIKESHVLLNTDPLRPGIDRIYPEAPLTRSITEDVRQGNTLVRGVPSRSSDRAQSPASSGVGSAIVDGCGGHCVAFENVCYYVLQIVFVMGILIGISLCMAGSVLKRTKKRDLQVLVYIGAMSSMVCALLLIVQCRVRIAIRNRKRAIRLARTVIPLGDMRPVQQPLISLRNESIRPGPNLILQRPPEPMADEQGVPWWRTDHPNNRV